jgi:hypothetical protein
MDLLRGERPPSAGGAGGTGQAEEECLLAVARLIDSILASVVGLVGSPCPVCGVIPLRGRQTVCSAACRRRQSRRAIEALDRR